jgi:hypothetical protein
MVGQASGAGLQGVADAKVTLASPSTICAAKQSCLLRVRASCWITQHVAVDGDRSRPQVQLGMLVSGISHHAYASQGSSY